MYVAKRRGATFEYYDAAHDENTVRKLAIGGELRAAIASNALELHFQPQVNLRSGMVESAEALLRWFHPTQGAIGPDEFIAIAEATDLIRPLTEWTLRGALAQIRAWRDRGVHVRIAVNLSARLLQDTAFPGAAAAAARRVGRCRRVARARDHRERDDARPGARAARDPGDRRGSACSSPSTTSAPAIRRSATCATCRCTRSSSTSPSSWACATTPTIASSSSPPRRWRMRCKLELVAEGVETEWDAQFLAAAGYDYRAGLPLLARAAGRQVPGVDRGVQRHRDAHAGRHQRDRARCARAPSATTKTSSRAPPETELTASSAA